MKKTNIGSLVRYFMIFQDVIPYSYVTTPFAEPVFYFSKNIRKIDLSIPINLRLDP